MLRSGQRVCHRARAHAKRLWGGHANVDSPGSGSGSTITAGWHTLVRVWSGQQVRQYIDGLRTNTVAVTATGGWTIYRWGWQFTGSEALDEAYVPFFGAFGAAWTTAWSPAGAPIRSVCCGRRWMRRS
jgi:hypothetical protein